jgi:hypothetical protein
MESTEQIIRITHHTDCGYRYSRVWVRFADGTSTMRFAQGHV